MASIPSGGTLMAVAKAADARQVMDAILADLNALQSALGGGLGGNLLVNGGMRITQRGAGPFVANNALTADRWGISLSGGSTTSVDAGVTASPPARASHYAAIAYAHAGGGSMTLEQLVEWWALCKGQTLSLSAWVWADQPGMARLLIQDGIAAVGSAYHPGDSAWHRLDLTATASPSATTLKAALQLANLSGAARFTSAMLVFGSQPVDWAPRPYATEQALAERYFEQHGGAAGFPYVRGYSAVGAGDAAAVGVPFRTRKGGVPSVTKAGTWGVNNANQPTVPQVNQDGYLLQITSLAAGYFDATPNSADDLITAQWDPT